MTSRVPNLQHLLATLNESLGPNLEAPSQWSHSQTNHHSPGSSSSSSPGHVLSSQQTSYPINDHSSIPLRSNHSTVSNSNSNDHLHKRDNDLRGTATYPSRPPSTLTSQPIHVSTPQPLHVPDASLITTWPAALKHMNRHIIPDERLTSKIKHLISQQRKHEHEWWNQREAILNRHAGRSDNQDKAAELLKSLGVVSIAPVVQVSPGPTEEQELKDFDKKVHKALGDMARDYDGQLRKLGVPGFAISRELVVRNDEMVADSKTTQSGGEVKKGRIDKGDLRELHRRVLEHLEDSLD